MSLTGDGSLVAAGDYSGLVTLRSVAEGSTLFEHTFEPIGGPSFIWAVSLAEDGSTLCAGSWNGQVCVWKNYADPATGVKSWQSLLEGSAAIKRTDRVFTVSLTQDGTIMAVGDRSGHATVYRLPRASHRAASGEAGSTKATKFAVGDVVSVVKEGSSKAGHQAFVEDPDWNSMARVRLDGKMDGEGTKSYKPLELAHTSLAAEVLLSAKYPNRIYTVALSSDGAFFALAGVHKEVELFFLLSKHLARHLTRKPPSHQQVWLYSVGSSSRLHVFHCTASLQTIAFTELPTAGQSKDARRSFALAAGGEVRHCYPGCKAVKNPPLIAPARSSARRTIQSTCGSAQCAPVT